NYFAAKGRPSLRVRTRSAKANLWRRMYLNYWAASSLIGRETSMFLWVKVPWNGMLPEPCEFIRAAQIWRYLWSEDRASATLTHSTLWGCARIGRPHFTT